MCIWFVFARWTSEGVPAVQIGEWTAVPLASIAADRDEAVGTCARLGGFLLYVGECAFCAWRNSADGVEEDPGGQGPSGGSRPAEERMIRVSVHEPPFGSRRPRGARDPGTPAASRDGPAAGCGEAPVWLAAGRRARARRRRRQYLLDIAGEGV